MALALVLSFSPLQKALAAMSRPEKIAQIVLVGLLVVIGILTYVAAAALLRSPELNELAMTVKKKLRRA